MNDYEAGNITALINRLKTLLDIYPNQNKIINRLIKAGDSALFSGESDNYLAYIHEVLRTCSEVNIKL